MAANGRWDLIRRLKVKLVCFQKVVPWLRWLIAGLLPRTPVFDPRSVHMGFMLDKFNNGRGLHPII